MDYIHLFISMVFKTLFKYTPDSFIEKMENNNFCFKWTLKIKGFVSHITNKFIDKKTNQRISGQILNMNKLNERKKAKAFGKSDERSDKISTTSTGYTNRSENSIISNAAPSSLYENSFEQNKNNNTINDNNNNSWILIYWILSKIN